MKPFLSIFLTITFVFGLHSENTVVRKDLFHTRINWTGNHINAVIHEKIPAVVFDPDDPRYHNEESANNLTEARNVAMSRGKKRLNIALVRSIEKLVFNTEEKIEDKIQHEEIFRDKYNAFFQNDLVSYSVKYIKNTVSIAGTLMFYGESGLINYLDVEFLGNDFPDYPKVKYPPSYTGLIVDARHLEINPALFPRIFADNGLEIYSVRFVEKNSVLSRGVATYFSDPVATLKQKKAGDNPLYVMALSAKGKHQSDLVIASKEAAKLLATESSRKALKKCKVVILLKP